MVTKSASFEIDSPWEWGGWSYSIPSPFPINKKAITRIVTGIWRVLSRRLIVVNQDIFWGFSLRLEWHFVAGAGHDPATSGLWIRRSNQLSYPAILLCQSEPSSSYKNSRPVVGIFGWDRRIRTLTDRARICSATITPYLNDPSKRDCKCMPIFDNMQIFVKNLAY